MDNFIDKLAQKFTAGEVIRANQAAEELELRKLREQVAEYERCLQEMRKQQLRNTEAAEGLKEFIEQSRAGLESITTESLNKLEQIKVEKEKDKFGDKVDEALNKVLQTLETNQKEIADWFKQADDFLHKENVKVYRNVQAVLVDESKAKTEAIIAGQDAAARKYYRRTMWIMVLVLWASVTGVVLQIMGLYGLL